MERRKWSQAEIEAFEKAWIYLQEQSPKITEIVAEFNNANPAGWRANFYIERYQWGLLEALIPTGGNPGRRAERIIEQPSWYMKVVSGNSPSIPVRLATEEEANLVGDFVASIGSKFELNVRRLPSYPTSEISLLKYPLKPYFERFK